MAFSVKNRTKQTSTTNGTTNVVMTGSVSGFQTFGNALSDGDTTYYAIVDPANGTWEVGLGTWASGTSTLTRTTIIESSSGSSAINFTGSVSKDVFITEPASKSLLEGSSAISNAEFLKKSGNVIEGRSASEVRSDLNVEDGATANSAGNAISISNGVINHSDTSSQSSSNNSGRTYIQDITLDTYGHVTGLATATETVTDTNTTYSAGSGIDLSGTTFSHSDTSSQSSSNNSGRTYIQDITLDTYGHVTGIATATETVTNTNTTYSAGTNLGLSGTTFNLNNSITLSGTAQAARYYIDGTSKYIDSVSGDYGTIAVTGNTNSWAGYAINDDFVFMGLSSDRCGIYNDTDNEWMAQFYRNAQVDLYYNGSVSLGTKSWGVDIAGILQFTNNNHQLETYNSQNPEINTNNSGSVGLLIRNSSNANPVQLYGSTNDYGFLGTAWGSWDIRKTRSGKLYTNNNTTYYLQPNNMTKILNLNILGRLESNGSSGTSGQVLTSNGTSRPTWQDAGGGAHTIIKRFNGSNANSVQFINGSNNITLDSTSYRGYRIVGWAIRNSGNSSTNNILQVYTGNSSGYGGIDGYYLNYRWLYSQDQQFGAGVSNGGSWAYDSNINYCIWWGRVRGKNGSTEGAIWSHTTVTPIDIYFPAIGFASNRRCYCYSTETFGGYASANNYQISKAFLVGREKENRTVDRIKLQMNVYGGQTSGGNMDYDFTLMGIN